MSNAEWDHAIWAAMQRSDAAEAAADQARGSGGDGIRVLRAPHCCGLLCVCSECSGLSCVYLIVFWSLRSQVLGLGGSAGLYPVRTLLVAIRVDVDRIEGIAPAATAVEQARRPSTWRSRLRRWAWFPTVCWLAPDSDRLLALIPSVGCACAALSALSGGILARAALVACWLCFLSLATVLSEFLSFPWDCLLLEVSALTMLLPLLPSALWSGCLSGSDDSATALQSPPPPRLLVFLFHFLLCRLMFGMGKKKFVGQSMSIVNDTRAASKDTHAAAGKAADSKAASNSTRPGSSNSDIKAASSHDWEWMRWVLLWQPLPTPLAACMFRRLPRSVYAPLLLGLFIVEIPLPFFGFIHAHSMLLGLSGAEWRALMCVCTIALQICIACVGNYGCFNLLTALLSLTLLESGGGEGGGTGDASSVHLERSANWAALLTLPFGWASSFFGHLSLFRSDLCASSLLLDLFGLLIFVGSLLYLPFDSYFSQTFLYSPATTQSLPYSALPGWLLRLYRACAPFHLIHAYGVFGVSVPQHDQKIIVLWGCDDTERTRADKVEAHASSCSSSSHDLLVSNLSARTGSAHLREIFSSVGRVLSAELLAPDPTQAIVEMSSDSEADAAVAALHQCCIDGQRVSVQRRQAPAIATSTRPSSRWYQYRTRFLASAPSQPLRWIAPLQPRLDHVLYYEALRQRACYYTYLNPYNFGPFTLVDRLAQRILQGSPSVLALLDGPPAVRPKLIAAQRFSFVFREHYEQECREQRARDKGAEAAVAPSSSPSSSSAAVSASAFDAAVLAHRRSFELEMLEPRSRLAGTPAPVPPSFPTDADELASSPPSSSSAASSAVAPVWHRLLLENLPPTSSAARRAAYADSDVYSAAELSTCHVPDAAVFRLPEPTKFFWTHHTWRCRYNVD